MYQSIKRRSPGEGPLGGSHRIGGWGMVKGPRNVWVVLGGNKSKGRGCGGSDSGNNSKGRGGGGPDRKKSEV